VCLTAHQCYRYSKKFGLLIIDEYDAFPLKGDNVLLQIVKNTSFQKIIYLSATFSKSFLLNKIATHLNRRHHNHDLSVPKLKFLPKFLYIFELLKFILNNRKNPLFIFVPTIKEAKMLKIKLACFFVKSTSFTSKSQDKEKIIDDIRKGKIRVTVCTTILERGITIPNLNVCVYNANERVFDEQTLIQICGRVGRKTNAPTGKILFIANRSTKAIESCIQNINERNATFTK